jgi:replicative DNA helicase
MNGGRIPPQAIEEEAAVIGYCMNYLDGYDRCREFLQPDHFYQERHKLIWIAISSVKGNRMTPDLLSVARELADTNNLENAGGRHYLMTLTTCPSRNLEPFAKLIRQKAIHRGRIKVAQRMIESAFDGVDDCFDALVADRKALTALEPSVSKLVEMSDLVVPIINGVEAAMRGEMKAMYLGFSEFDADYAFLPKEVVIIGADSGTGKTAFTLQVVKRMRKRYPRMPWVFNSLEMDDESLTSRDMASSVGISAMRMRTGSGVDAGHIGAMAELPGNYKGVYVVRCKTQAELEARIRQVKKMLGLPEDAPVGAVTDYIQLMTGKGGNREQEISSIAVEGQTLAKDNNVLYFMLSQFNRSAKKDRPTMGSLRESGAIEHVADWIFLGYNPFKNGETNYSDGSSTEGIIEWNAAKVRFGKANDTKKVFMDNAGLFRDINERRESSQLVLPEIKPNLNYAEPLSSEDNEEYHIGRGGDHFPF